MLLDTARRAIGGLLRIVVSVFRPPDASRNDEHSLLAWHLMAEVRKHFANADGTCKGAWVSLRCPHSFFVTLESQGFLYQEGGFLSFMILREEHLSGRVEARVQ